MQVVLAQIYNLLMVIMSMILLVQLPIQMIPHQSSQKSVLTTDLFPEEPIFHSQVLDSMLELQVLLLMVFNVLLILTMLLLHSLPVSLVKEQHYQILIHLLLNLVIKMLFFEINFSIL
jgi:hypothetical protein